MLVFPITLTENGKDFYCRFIALSDGAYRLSFWENERERADIRVSNLPQNGEYVLVESAVSGGTYREYLSDVMQRYGGRVCLYLRPFARRFFLPCPDGFGHAIPPCEQAGDRFSYSDTLCCLWRVSCAPEPHIDLIDNSFTLRKKYDLAESSGVPILIADDSILEKMKAPCKQGALDLMIEERDQ